MISLNEVMQKEKREEKESNSTERDWHTHMLFMITVSGKCYKLLVVHMCVCIYTTEGGEKKYS